MLETKKDRFNEAIRHLKGCGLAISQKDIAAKMHVNEGNLSRAKNGDDSYLTDSFLKRFNNSYDDIFNEEWLLHGNADMLTDKGRLSTISLEEFLAGMSTDQQKSITNKIGITACKNYIAGVPYYDVDFIAGFDIIFNDQTRNPDYLIDFEKYNGASCWCNVSGQSMEPELNNGDIIALKEIEDFSFLPLGEMYAIVTTNSMRTIKRLGKGENDDEYMLIPSNPNPPFSPQPLKKELISRVFQVLGCMKRL